jgi:2-oxoglutarate dehydrogenase complex dehydrogenase (E1) component-like enzyme
VNKKNKVNNTNSSSTTSVYALLVISSLFVVGSGVLASDVAAQNMTGGNATGPELMASVVNNTNATTSPEASMGISGVTELSEGNVTITNQSGQ